MALPTIKERGDAWAEVAEAWMETCPLPLLGVPSWAPGGWVAGLNEVWEAHSDAEVYVAGSDDMCPDPGWYEAIEPYLARGVIAPQVVDPRFTRFGPEVSDGDETDMSSFPILSQRIAARVFPLPAEGPQHYYADNWISDIARGVGFPTIAVPSAVIVHRMDERARGAGMGSESERMAYDRAIYRKVLSESG